MVAVVHVAVFGARAHELVVAGRSDGEAPPLGLRLLLLEPLVDGLHGVPPDLVLRSRRAEESAGGVLLRGSVAVGLHVRGDLGRRARRREEAEDAVRDL